jgi:hypothetical protein
MAIESGNNHAKDIKVDRLPHGQSLSAEQRGGIQGLEGAAAGVTEHQIFAPDMPAGPSRKYNARASLQTLPRKHSSRTKGISRCVFAR